MDKQKPDPSKRLAYGPVLRKETAEKFGVDTQSVIEYVTGAPRFSEELAKPTQQEEEFLRWTTNRALTTETIEKIVKHIKKNKLDISNSKTWNPALEAVNAAPAEEPAPIPTVVKYDFKAVAKVCLDISDSFLELANLLKGM
jgi:hypothetical protein